MNKLLLFVFAIVMSSCATTSQNVAVQNTTAQNDFEDVYPVQDREPSQVANDFGKHVEITLEAKHEDGLISSTGKDFAIGKSFKINGVPYMVNVMDFEDDGYIEICKNPVYKKDLNGYWYDVEDQCPSSAGSQITGKEARQLIDQIKKGRYSLTLKISNKNASEVRSGGYQKSYSNKITSVKILNLDKKHPYVDRLQKAKVTFD